MSLRPCKECGHQISSDAKVCPQCGKKQRRSTGLGLGCLAIIGVAVLFATIASLTEHHADNTLSPAEKKARQEEEVRFERAVLGAKQLRASMRNPESFRLAQALIMVDGAVCYEYRAQNGFGGVNSGYAVLLPTGRVKTNEMAGFRRLWNAWCAKKPGANKTWEVQYGLKHVRR